MSLLLRLRQAAVAMERATQDIFLPVVVGSFSNTHVNFQNLGLYTLFIYFLYNLLDAVAVRPTVERQR